MKNNTLIIWYNPDTDAYEKGCCEQYRSVTTESNNADRFEMLYEFEGMEASLADKILLSLNNVRKINRGMVQFSVA